MRLTVTAADNVFASVPADVAAVDQDVAVTDHGPMCTCKGGQGTREKAHEAEVTQAAKVQPQHEKMAARRGAAQQEDSN